MRTIVILGYGHSVAVFPIAQMRSLHLISHDHELPISQAAHVRIVLIVLKTHNLLDILDLFILHNLIVLRLAYVEKLAAQREDAKVVTPDHTKSSHGERLGGITFGQYERALGCVARSGIVCICELGDTRKAVKKMRSTKAKDRV